MWALRPGRSVLPLSVCHKSAGPPACLAEAAGPPVRVARRPRAIPAPPEVERLQINDTNVPSSRGTFHSIRWERTSGRSSWGRHRSTTRASRIRGSSTRGRPLPR